SVAPPRRAGAAEHLDPERRLVRLAAPAVARRHTQDAATGLAPALGPRHLADPRRMPARPPLGPEAPPGAAPGGRARPPLAGGQALMFFDGAIVGDRLPPGILCLTYDDGPGRTDGDEDGPGPRTAELGEYLHSQGVPATFFAVGRFAAGSGDIL